MFRNGMLAGLLLGLLVIGSSARAQFRGIKLPASVQNVMLLNTEAVQKELGLDADQIDSLAALATQMHADALEIMSGLQDLTPEEQKQAMPEMMKMITEKGRKIQAKVDGLLQPKQAARLNELSLQRRGVAALGDTQVSAALKITDEQKKKLAAIREQSAVKQKEIDRQLAKGVERAKIRATVNALRKEFNAMILAVLTDDQRKQFEQMQGARFEFPPGSRGFPF
jgi:Spy/CpxP family protein refolding chaperone